MPEADRLRFALAHLAPTDWEAFEQFANAYLASDFPELRPVAGVNDGGRDAILCGPSTPHIVVQSSIEDDWNGKITKTLARLAEVGHPCTGLIYATSRDVGRRADQLRRDLLAQGVLLDVRDREYFVVQLNATPARVAAARELATRVVNPLLPGDELVRNSPVASPELRVGLLYLELQLQDADEGRNITRLTYDTLVLGALRETAPDTRKTRDQIISYVAHILSTRPRSTVTASVNGSLQRLRHRRRIVVTLADDSFALHYDERVARTEAALRLLDHRRVVRQRLADLVRASADELEIPYPVEGSEAFLDTTEQLFETTLADQGNRFAEAVRARASADVKQDLLSAARTQVTRNATVLRGMGVSHDVLVELAAHVASTALLVGGPVRAYLRELADAYTLLAFMQEAPDVQSAVDEFFSRGTLLLDTSVLLPCFAETLLAEDEQGYTNLLRGAREAGMRLFITRGVLNEIDAHLALASQRHRRGPREWIGDPPRVYADWFTLTGGGGFPWVYRALPRDRRRGRYSAIPRTGARRRDH